MKSTPKKDCFVFSSVMRPLSSEAPAINSMKTGRTVELVESVELAGTTLYWKSSVEFDVELVGIVASSVELV